MRGADSSFSETYMEYGKEKPQASATKQMGMRDGLPKLSSKMHEKYARLRLHFWHP